MLEGNKSCRVGTGCHKIGVYHVEINNSHGVFSRYESDRKVLLNMVSRERFGKVLLILSLMLVLTCGLSYQPVFSQEIKPDSVRVGAGAFDEGPDGNPFKEVDETRREVESGKKTQSIFSAKSEPLHKLWNPLVDKLNNSGLDITINYTAMVQNSNDLIPGIGEEVPGAQNTLSGGDFDFALKWSVLKRGEPWSGYFRLSVEHRHPYSKQPPILMGPQTGSVWLSMRGWTEYDNIGLTEAYWHQGTLKSPFEYRIGRIKNTTIWNGGKYISGNTGIVGGQFTGTPACVTFFSGWSVNAVYHPVDGNWHITAGVFQANGKNETFEPLYLDQLIYGVQAGFKPELWGYKGRYHIFAWHADATENKTKANGFALNAEHTFNAWTPFIRYSFGDQDRTDPQSHGIRQSANIGVGYDGPFGHSKDWVAIVFTWAEPTDATHRDQYGMEIDYSFRLTPNSTFTPHYQLIWNPSQNPTKNSVSIIGLRAKIDF